MDAQKTDLELPQPQYGQPQTGGGSLSGDPLAQQVVKPLPPGGSVGSFPSVNSPQQFTQPPSPSGSGPDTAQVSIPASADDADLIEKEWVVKAKQIVQKTKEDPYTQNKEITKFKAEYMKKRYNRDIKLIEE